MPTQDLPPALLAALADRFKGLGEPARLQLLQALRRREATVSELVGRTGLSQANVSKHLRLLRGLGFVERRKQGLNAYYRLADPDVFKLCDLMCGRVERELKSQRRILLSR